MIYQDLSSVLCSFIRLMIRNCFKNHFTCAITHRFLTNQNAHNYSVVVLGNSVGKKPIVYCAAKLVLTSFKDHMSYHGCKEKINLDHITYSNPYFLERLLSGACHNFSYESNCSHFLRVYRRNKPTWDARRKLEKFVSH